MSSRSMSLLRSEGEWGGSLPLIGTAALLKSMGDELCGPRRPRIRTAESPNNPTCDLSHLIQRTLCIAAAAVMSGHRKVPLITKHYASTDGDGMATACLFRRVESHRARNLNMGKEKTGVHLLQGPTSGLQ